MAGIVAIVSAISDYVVAQMAAAGLPPLTDGAIALGSAKSNENSAPPRIIFIPTTTRYGPPSSALNSSPISPSNPDSPGSGIRSFTAVAMGSGYVQGSTTVTISAPDVVGGVQATATAKVSNGAVISILPNNIGSGYLNPPTVTIGGVGTGASFTARLLPTPQAQTVIVNRTIKTEYQKFDVAVWATTSSGGVLTPDVTTDYDATQQIVHAIIAACQALAAGVHEIGPGLWYDSTDGATVVDALGHYFMFSVEFATPVLAFPIPPSGAPPVGFGPSNTSANPSLFIRPFGGGTPEPP